MLAIVALVRFVDQHIAVKPAAGLAFAALVGVETERV